MAVATRRAYVDSVTWAGEVVNFDPIQIFPTVVVAVVAILLLAAHRLSPAALP